MKAVILRTRNQPDVSEVPVPSVGDDEILVKMRFCGVCGTDIEKIRGEAVTPPVLGHEVSGEVAKVGKNVSGFQVGDPVVIHHHVPCGNCYFCRRGDHTMCEEFVACNIDPCGFSEFFRVPSRLVKGGAVHRLEDRVSAEEAALAEPTGCCIRALNKAGVGLAESVLVVGAGPIGLTMIQLLRLRGCTPIIASETIERRRLAAAEFGADNTINPSAVDIGQFVKEKTQGVGVDVAILATGNTEAIRSAEEAVRKGGKLVIFGAPPKGATIPLDMSRLFIRELSMVPSYSTTETEISDALKLIAARQISLDKMITHRFPLEESVKAFETATEAKDALKVMVYSS